MIQFIKKTAHARNTHSLEFKKISITRRGGFRGGGRPPPPPSGIRPPADPKGPILILFQKSICGRPTPKIFLKAPLAPIYTNFEGERAKKTKFFCQNFSKSAQKRAENLAKIGAKQCFGRARKINLIDLKKKVVKIFEIFFLKSQPTPPPLLDPPLITSRFKMQLHKCLNDSLV